MQQLMRFRFVLLLEWLYCARGSLLRARQQFIIHKAKEKAGGNCAFFDTTTVDPGTYEPVTKYRDWEPDPPEAPFDGIHYRYKKLVPQANAWAEKVFEKFKKSNGL